MCVSERVVETQALREEEEVAEKNEAMLKCVKCVQDEKREIQQINSCIQISYRNTFAAYGLESMF